MTHFLLYYFISHTHTHTHVRARARARARLFLQNCKNRAIMIRQQK